MPAAPHPPVSFAVGRLVVRFLWRHDRWAHEVDLPDGGSWRSVEGGDPDGGDPSWPASPVLTDLSRLDAQPAILGVGRAGRSHFSASVGRDPDDPDGVRFEIACRVHDLPGWLGSTYAGPDGVVRIAAARLPPGPPATVQWGYSLSGRGVRPILGAEVRRPQPPEH